MCHMSRSNQWWIGVLDVCSVGFDATNAARASRYLTTPISRWRTRYNQSGSRAHLRAVVLCKQSNKIHTRYTNFLLTDSDWISKTELQMKNSRNNRLCGECGKIQYLPELQYWKKSAFPSSVITGSANYWKIVARHWMRNQRPKKTHARKNNPRAKSRSFTNSPSFFYYSGTRSYREKSEILWILSLDSFH